MGKTALELSEKEWQAYRPDSRFVEKPDPDRLNRAWSLARTAADVLRAVWGDPRSRLWLARARRVVHPLVGHRSGCLGYIA